jgi:uncharacterized repeat protein (TIGR02543 family)
MKSKWILAGLILALCVLVGCPGGGGGDDPYTPPPGPQGPWTVSFDTDGGTPVEAQTVAHNGKVTPVSTTKSGYQFGKWYTDVNLNNAWDFENSLVTKNMTLYAEWYEIPDGWFNVNFVTYGGSPVDDQVIEEGNLVIEPPAPTKEGFLFAAWYSDADLTQEWYFAIATIIETTTLYAKWNKAFTVTFNSNGGTAVEKQIIPSGGQIRYIEPVKNGFRFFGWYAEAALTNEWDFDEGVTANMTLYAKWVESFPATIHFVPNTEEYTVEDLNVSTGSKIKRPRVLTRTSDNKACIGWFRDETFEDEWDFLTMEVEGNMTLYAEWGTAVNVWLSSNHADPNNPEIFGGAPGQWDTPDAKIPERQFLQRKDGTHYMDLCNAGTSYFRFWIEGPAGGGTSLNGRFQASSNDFQVVYNNPMNMSYVAGNSGTKNSWKFYTDGDFVIILDARDSSNRHFILPQPYTITSIDVTPPIYATDAGKAFTYQYAATVTGENAPQAVTWTIEGATEEGTTISQTGLVSVSADETPKTLTIRATSKSDARMSSTARLVLQEPSNEPIVTGISVSPTAASVMKAALANGSVQLHASLPDAQYRGLQFTASAAASGGASEAVTYSILETVKPGTQISATGYLTVALNETLPSFTVRIASAEPGFEDIHVDVPITVKSFEVWLIGSSTEWSRGDSFKMTDNGDGTYTWTGSVANSSVNGSTHEGISFNTNKTTGGGEGGTLGWGNDAWYTLSTTNVQLAANTFALRTFNGQANMFRVSAGTYTFVLDVMVPNVTVTVGP